MWGKRETVESYWELPAKGRGGKLGETFAINLGMVDIWGGRWIVTAMSHQLQDYFKFEGKNSN